MRSNAYSTVPQEWNIDEHAMACNGTLIREIKGVISLCIFTLNCLRNSPSPRLSLALWSCSPCKVIVLCWIDNLDGFSMLSKQRSNEKHHDRNGPLMSHPCYLLVTPYVSHETRGIAIITICIFCGKDKIFRVHKSSLDTIYSTQLWLTC